ncbi:MAG TPA: hypothetical protein VM307_05785, partial [Egibacteraceae bacterium]|nr:hypothetical protein [Egibacteraceae bacterium]
LADSTAERLRLVVAPANGRFRPHVTSGSVLRGDLLAVLTGSRGREVEVRCPADLHVAGLLALPGQLVTAGQALLWASLGDACAR